MAHLHRPQLTLTHTHSLITLPQVTTDMTASVGMTGIPAPESAAGILKQVSALDKDTSGTFVNRNGKPLRW